MHVHRAMYLTVCKRFPAPPPWGLTLQWEVDSHEATAGGRGDSQGHIMVQGLECQASNRKCPSRAPGVGVGVGVGIPVAFLGRQGREGPSAAYLSTELSTVRQTFTNPQTSPSLSKSLPQSTWVARATLSPPRIPAGHQGALTVLSHQALLDVADVGEEIAHCRDLWAEAHRL